MAAPAPFRGRTGQVVNDRYELLEMIGSGGQSVVYRAHDRRTNRDVAAKICEWRDKDAHERMFREALMMAELAHTHAVKVLDQCKTEDGVMALMMELLHGTDLASVMLLREARSERGDAPFLVSVLGPVVETLAAAHERGIIHRDIKAENVFVLDERAGGGVRLLDFGFGKMLRLPGITSAEAFAGSPSYIAPEVWLEGVSQVDARVDVYAFAVLAYRMLAGKMPFEGSHIDISRKAMTSPRPSLHALRPDLSPDVDHWVKQALAILPRERFSKIDATWRALLDCLNVTGS